MRRKDLNSTLCKSDDRFDCVLVYCKYLLRVKGVLEVQ